MRHCDIFLVENLDKMSKSSGDLGGVVSETLHVVLDEDPGLHVGIIGSSQLCGEILVIHVVNQLGNMLHVEDVKVKEIIIDELTNHGLS